VSNHQGQGPPNAAVINTASGSGVTLPNAGQANYGAAKAGIAALTLIAAEELDRYGVNAIAPIAHSAHAGHPWDGRDDG
jgi:NAD(P)-dependent dehydrogenase (short-subunit alcohol dehydrogenase family)